MKKIKYEEEWIARRSGSAKNRKNDTRPPYVRDRARMIHSASFRRLQAKTQVLGIGESDFYRTRLTHSLEVAQIGSGIVKKLRNIGRDCNADWEEHLPSESLVETICLAHDIGHPPFGHGGEVALNFMMRNHGGFEGNGQTLRILSKLDKYTEFYGMDLTRRSMLGVIKYPVIYSKAFSNKHQCTSLKDKDLVNRRKIKAKDWKPPKCIFDEDESILNWILDPFSQDDSDLFMKVKDGKACKENKNHTEHNKSIYKSFDTTIMDLADDIAYGIHDLEDAISLKIVSRESWDDEVLKLLINSGSDFNGEDISTISNSLFSQHTYERKSAIGGLVNWLITSIIIQERNNFKHPYLKYEATLNEQNENALSIIQDYVVNRVIKSAEVQLLEYKGQQMIIEIFEAISSDPERLLPEFTKKVWIEAGGKDNPDKGVRVICDFISGMTDDFASRVYKSLFVAGDGSIFNRL